MATVAAEIIDVRKTFGPTVALDRVSLRAFTGEVHAIIGGNGSGKSTLAKVISGVLVPDQGQVSIFGKSATNPSESRALGISNVYQEVLVADECSVIDNLFLGADGLFSTAEPYDERYARAEKIMRELLGFDLDPETIVGELPLSIKQWITIARGMLTDPRVLILDESSAALDFEATQRLFRKMRELTAQGCAIFIVTHRIAELVQIADRATVLRDGVSVGTLNKEEITEEQILHLIAGPERESAHSTSKPVEKQADRPVLRANDMRVWPDTAAFDFNLYPGEVVGVTGLDGQGQADFVQSLAGIEPALGGAIHTVHHGVAEPIFDLHSARHNGIAYVSGDRKKEGIFPNLSIYENMCLSIYPEYSAGGPFNFVNRQKLDPIFEHETGNLATKMGDPGNLITSLSGGNQQKILIARSFAERPRVLVLNDPARGIDVGAKLDLYRNLRAFAARGNAVVFLSSEIEEFIDLCNRVLVFRGGADAPRDQQEDCHEPIGFPAAGPRYSAGQHHSGPVFRNQQALARAGMGRGARGDTELCLVDHRSRPAAGVRVSAQLRALAGLQHPRRCAQPEGGRVDDVGHALGLAGAEPRFRHLRHPRLRPRLWRAMAARPGAPLYLHALRAQNTDARPAARCRPSGFRAGDPARDDRPDKFHRNLWPGQSGAARGLTDRREQ